jgi:hypothetical protein
MINIHTLIAASPRILVLLWGITLPFCAFAGWLFLSLVNQNAPVPASVLAGFFLLIGVMLLAGLIEMTLHYLRYDAMHLTLTGEPPAVGKRIDGIVDLPTSAAAAWIGVEFACVHVSHERIGANRTVTFEKDCWSEKRQFPIRRSGRRVSAVVRFDIPDSLPPSNGTPALGAPDSTKSGGDRYVWELRVGAGGTDPELRRTLSVHVLPSAYSTCHAGPQTH